jgi:bacillithiol system protein YtxJ
MNWNKLISVDQVNEIVEDSKKGLILIFKHSTRCSISTTSLARLERNWNQQELGTIKPYYLDLISFREVSNLIAQKFDVEHQSPQVLIIQNGKSVFERSHLDIDYTSVKQMVLGNQKLNATV